MEKHYKNDCQIETYKKLYEISKQDSFEKVNMINKGETPTYYDVYTISLSNERFDKQMVLDDICIFRTSH